jgi:hypothetical protein
MRIARLVALLAISLAVLPAYASAAVGQAPSCTLYAGPGGDDANPGTEMAPVRTVTRLLAIAHPGAVACLAGGATFRETVTIRDGGTPAAPLVLESVPGTTATIVGRLWVADSANDVVIRDLALDGINVDRLPSPTVNGDRIVFYNDDVTNEHTAICFDLGNLVYGVAVDDVIDTTRVHDCGTLPANNTEHGIYVTRALRTRIVDSVIDHNADRGIQLFPSAMDTVVDHDILDANGEGIIFSGEGGEASSGTRVTATIVTNARIRYDIESWYPAGNPVGTDNLVRSVCVSGGAQGTISGGRGFTVESAVRADPQYADAGHGDYRLAASSPCLGYGPASIQPGSAPPPPGGTTSGGGDPAGGSGTTPTGSRSSGPGHAPSVLATARRFGAHRIRITWRGAGAATILGRLVRVGGRTIHVAGNRSRTSIWVGHRTGPIRVMVSTRVAGVGWRSTGMVVR